MYDEIADFCQLGGYMDMPVKTYSSGMFVRLAFAVAVSARPEILLVDEALAVGDAVFAHRCLARIREMREAGTTIVLVSHDTNMIGQVCDRAIFLDRGRLAAEGDPRDVVHHYLLSVAERLTAARAGGERLAARFHEIGAVESATGGGEASMIERRFGTFEARIFDLWSGRPSGEAGRRFGSGECAVFRMKVRFDADVSEPVFGLMIRNRYGMELFGTNTHLRKQPMRPARAGSAADVRFEIPLMLGGGPYSASFAVHTAAGHYYDYRVDALVFEVLQSPDCGGGAQSAGDH